MFIRMKCHNTNHIPQCTGGGTLTSRWGILSCTTGGTTIKFRAATYKELKTLMKMTTFTIRQRASTFLTENALGVHNVVKPFQQGMFVVYITIAREALHPAGLSMGVTFYNMMFIQAQLLASTAPRR